MTLGGEPLDLAAVAATIPAYITQLRGRSYKLPGTY